MRYIPLFLEVTLFVQDTDNYKPVESIQIATQFIF